MKKWRLTVSQKSGHRHTRSNVQETLIRVIIMDEENEFSKNNGVKTFLCLFWNSLLIPTCKNSLSGNPSKKEPPSMNSPASMKHCFISWGFTINQWWSIIAYIEMCPTASNAGFTGNWKLDVNWMLEVMKFRISQLLLWVPKLIIYHAIYLKLSEFERIVC